MRRVFRRRGAHQNVADLPGRDLIHQAQGFAPIIFRIDDLAQRPCVAEPRQTAIKLHQILQRDPDATKTHREPRRLVLRQHQIGAGLSQPRRQARRADPIEQGDRRHVEGLLQRPAHRDGALKRHVEIFRSVGAEPDRPIVDQAFRMHKAVLERETIDERF